MYRSEAVRKFEQLKKLHRRSSEIMKDIIDAYPVFNTEDTIVVLSYPDDFSDDSFTNVLDHGVVYDYEIEEKRVDNVSTMREGEY